MLHEETKEVFEIIEEIEDMLGLWRYQLLESHPGAEKRFESVCWRT